MRRGYGTRVGADRSLTRAPRRAAGKRSGLEYFEGCIVLAVVG